MPLVTDGLALPYPETSDPADIPSDLQALADRLEVLLYDGDILLAAPGDLKYCVRDVDHGRWLKLDGRELTQGEIETALSLDSGDAAAFVSLMGTGASSKYGSAAAGKVKLVDARRQIPMSAGPSGDGSGSFTARPLGSVGGAESFTLDSGNIPAHTHAAGSLAVASHSHDAGSLVTASHTHGVSGNTGTESADHTHSGTTGINSVDHVHGFSGNTGAGTSHSHGFGGYMVPGATGTGWAVVVRGGTGANALGWGGGGPGPNATDLTATAAEAAHTHPFSGTTGGVSANHTHGFTTGGRSAAHTHSFSVTSGSASPAVSGNTGSTAPSVSGNTGSTGSGSAKSHMPPFATIGFAFIRV